MKQLIMLMVCLLLLSACDNSGGDSNQNTSGPANNSITTMENASEEDSLMDISGAINQNTGSVSADWIQMESSSYPVAVIEIEGHDGYLGRLAYSGDLQPGTYEINKPLDSEYTQEGIFTAGLLYLYSPDEDKQYRESPTGTVTFHFGDRRIIGTFEFSASNIAGETVNVKGQFNAPISDGAAE